MWGVLVDICWESLQEALVVGTWHHDVGIVIPGDKALMPDGAQQRATSKGVADVICYAVLMNAFKYA